MKNAIFEAGMKEERGMHKQKELPTNGRQSYEPWKYGI